MQHTSKRQRADHRKSPPIEGLTHRNIESILRLEDQERHGKPLLYRVVARLAAFCGTVTFLWINLAIFLAWIVLNETIWRADPYPFTFLLFLVSLEAIVLSILILISQNMAGEESERRHLLDLEINLLAEREMTALLRLTTQIAEKVGVSTDAQREVRTLTEEINPKTVLHQIAEAEAAHER